MEPLQGSIWARFSASLRSSARLSGQLSFRFRHWSSLNTTSNTQCRLFPIPQWACAIWLNRSGRNACSAGSTGSQRCYGLPPGGWRYLPHCRQAGPLVPLLQPGHAAAYACRPGLDTPVPLIGLACLCRGHGRIVEEQAHVIVERLLIPLQGQHVSGPARNRPLGPAPAGTGVSGSAWRQR